MKNLLQFCFIYYKIEEVTDRRVLEKGFRACLKKHSRNLHAPLCGIFCPNSVAVARYGALIRTKSPTNCDAHLAESLFQTRSKAYDVDETRSRNRFVKVAVSDKPGNM